MMNKHLVAFLSTITMLATTTIAYSETILIAAGSEEGEYTKTIVPAINKALIKYGYRAHPEISLGSQENIDNVWSGRRQAALSQLDVAALNMTEERPADAQGELIFMGQFAPEALFCAAKKGGPVASIDDLTDPLKPKLKVSVGQEGSGTARTFEYLIKLEPKLSQVELLKEGNPTVQLNRLLSGGRDLVCFVLMPNLENELVKTVLEHEKLMFIDINKTVFTEATIAGIHVYDLMEITVDTGFWGFGSKKIKTLVTWVGLVVNEKLTDDVLLRVLSKVALQENLLHPDSLAAKAKALFEQLKAKITN
jgi:TRAP-type uncharacterized transport system substrate-binding protein